ncbi:hypothetical protein [Streptomyces griseorubiginosus]|uniref:hypothetical protein n=1 Tax=Streptomyces griseorubiginosus TaxID=67304 RepID=UPI001AD6D5C8|nr:hypothetical protein [Streptomyces griseorubiginosus]MBO4256320.1 hypothetical protein [Streptomyces griseorubiginosus]
MSIARHLSRIRIWLRVLVLLLALLVPGETHAAASVPVSPECVQCDATEVALPPVVRAAARAVVPLRPAPLPDPAPQEPGVTATTVLPRAPHALRTVVLRC